jgi:6-pyruvoyltetrahydropterin/6-carboxytetrahydropterin synthase
MRIGIIDHIDSAHCIPHHETCNEMHGHTYTIELRVEGRKGESGMVIDFMDLKKILREVLDGYDHRVLNDIIDVPTCENLTEDIRVKLEKKIDMKFTLRVWEGKNKWVEL